MPGNADQSRARDWGLNSGGLLRWGSAIIVCVGVVLNVKSDGRDTSTRLEFTAQNERDDKTTILAALAQQKLDSEKALDEKKVTIEKDFQLQLEAQARVLLAQENELSSLRDYVVNQSNSVTEMKTRQEDIQNRVVDIDKRLTK